MVKNNLLELLVYFLLLAKNNITLALHGLALKLGVLENIADDVDSVPHILPEALRVVHSLLARRVRIEMSSEILYLDFERMLASTVCTFESHMFKEVRRAIRCVGLCARTRIYPDADGSCLRVRVRFCGDGQSIRKGGDFGGGC